MQHCRGWLSKHQDQSFVLGVSGCSQLCNSRKLCFPQQCSITTVKGKQALIKDLKISSLDRVTVPSVTLFRKWAILTPAAHFSWCGLTSEAWGNTKPVPQVSVEWKEMEMEQNLDLPPAWLQLHTGAVTFFRQCTLLIFWLHEWPESISEEPWRLTHGHSASPGLQHHLRCLRKLLLFPSSPTLAHEQWLTLACAQETEQDFAVRHFLALVV